ncbi:TrmB family transcriptional regulator [Archaeoglobales archaeon]|nr:MAG: TrmB family transcriptional regulator [Archaeoglobales archaeon]
MRSIKEMLMNLNCKNFLECFYGLNEADVEIFRNLATVGEARIEDLSVAVKKSENAVYKSLQKLLVAGLVVREKKLLNGGGYYYTYKPVDIQGIVVEMHKTIDEWYAKIKNTIDEFAKEFKAKV